MVEGALAAALYPRFWHCGRVLLRFDWELRRVVGAAARASCAVVALAGKPGQRHRHNASFTKERGGIGGVVVAALKFRKLNRGFNIRDWLVLTSVPSSARLTDVKCEAIDNIQTYDSIELALLITEP